MQPLEKGSGAVRNHLGWEASLRPSSTLVSVHLVSLGTREREPVKNQAHLDVFIYLFTDVYPACSSLLAFSSEIPEGSRISECTAWFSLLYMRMDMPVYPLYVTEMLVCPLINHNCFGIVQYSTDSTGMLTQILSGRSFIEWKILILHHAKSQVQYKLCISEKWKYYCVSYDTAALMLHWYAYYVVMYSNASHFITLS